MARRVGTYLPEGLSDHCTVKIAVLNGPLRTRKAFQFYNVWSSHPQFLERVENVWGIDIVGCKMLQAVKRLKLLIEKLKRSKWSVFQEHYNRKGKEYR